MYVWRAGRTPLLLFGAGQAAAQVPDLWGRSTGTANVSLIVTVLLAAVGLLIVLKVAAYLVRSLRTSGARAQTSRRVTADFGQEASRMGFKVAEIKTLRLVSARMAPEDADGLLTTEQGRARLSGYIERRLRRRERELEHLRGILTKLRAFRERDMRERATARVETNLAVWIVRKPGTAEGAEEEEGLYTDVEQVSGRVLDLSEGGAAVETELEAQPEDMVELWSADSEIWIPPVTASVLQVQRQGVRVPVFHLRFLDPPVGELRAAVQALQRHTDTGPS